MELYGDTRRVCIVDDCCHRKGGFDNLHRFRNSSMNPSASLRRDIKGVVEPLTKPDEFGSCFTVKKLWCVGIYVLTRPQSFGGE
jgi:hypothetical protein